MIFFLRMARNQEKFFILIMIMNQKNNIFEPCWRRKGTEETKSNRFLFIFCLYLFDILFDIYIYNVDNIYIILIIDEILL